MAHRCSPCKNFAHTRSVKLDIANWDMGMGHLWLNGSAFMA